MTTPTVQPSYAAAYTSVTFTSLNSLASSSTFVAGAEATAPTANSTTLAVDVNVAGSITVGTTPTANTQIRIYVVEALDETPTWPDVFDGTDSAETLTSVGVGQGFMRLGAVLNVDSTTSSRAYPFSFRVAPLFGYMPRNWTLFVTHNTVAALAASGHSVKYAAFNYIVPSV